MSRVLITGGAGFIGSHLAQRLVNDGYDVCIIDDLSRGSLSNLANFQENLDFFDCCVNNEPFLDRQIKDSDFVFHLSALSRVIPSIEKPYDCFKSNVTSVESIARLCSKHKKKLLFSSSREVYGNAKYLPVDENHPLNPENPYGASKVCGEQIITAYSKTYGLDYVIFRLTNVYGAKDFDRVIPIFIEKTRLYQPLIIYGGKQTIDFIHVDDVIKGFLEGLDLDQNGIINLGSGVGTNLKQLARIIQEIGEGKSELIDVNRRKGEVECFVANIDRAKRLLRWQPRISLTDGIRRLFNK